MGEHRQNKQALFSQMMPSLGGRELGWQIIGGQRAMKNVHILPAENIRTVDGKLELLFAETAETEASWHPLPKGHRVFAEGDQLPLDALEAFAALASTCKHPVGIIAAGGAGREAMTGIPIMDITAVPLADLMAQHDQRMFKGSE